MARRIERVLVTRTWYFTFWCASANTAFCAEAAVHTPSGDPTFNDALEIEQGLLEAAQEEHGADKVTGLICTGWYPLDDGEMTDE